MIAALESNKRILSPSKALTYSRPTLVKKQRHEKHNADERQDVLHGTRLRVFCLKLHGRAIVRRPKRSIAGSLFTETSGDSHLVVRLSSPSRVGSGSAPLDCAPKTQPRSCGPMDARGNGAASDHPPARPLSRVSPRARNRLSRAFRSNPLVDREHSRHALVSRVSRQRCAPSTCRRCRCDMSNRAKCFRA